MPLAAVVVRLCWCILSGVKNHERRSVLLDDHSIQRPYFLIMSVFTHGRRRWKPEEEALLMCLRQSYPYPEYTWEQFATIYNKSVTSDRSRTLDSLIAKWKSFKSNPPEPVPQQSKARRGPQYQLTVDEYIILSNHKLR